MPSFFEEQANQTELSHSLLFEKDGYRKYLDYYFNVVRNKLTPEKYMKFITEVKSKVDLPVLGSLNGVSVGRWINNAISMEEAGADALELNIYFNQRSKFVFVDLPM